MQRDPLATLARLRRLETEAAKRRLGEAFARLTAAEQRVAEAAAALQGETAAGAPADYAAWLRRGLAERDRAGLACGLATTGAATARALLVESRSAERALEALQEARDAELAQGAERRAQAVLDEAAARRVNRRPARLA